MKILYSDGDEYAGGVKDGMLHGEGRMVYANKDIYLGQWKEDCMDG